MPRASYPINHQWLGRGRMIAKANGLGQQRPRCGDPAGVGTRHFQHGVTALHTRTQGGDHRDARGGIDAGVHAIAASPPSSLIAAIVASSTVP